jgi:hypothetical protein
VIEKVYDIDPGEAQVLVPGEGWTFDVSGELVTTGADGQVVVDFDDIDGSVAVDITEDGAPDTVEEWVMIDGSCEVTADTNEQLEVAAVGDARGTLDIEAGAMTDVVVNAGETVTCTFTNETGEVEAATATPKVTPPPTDALPVTGTPGGDSWRIALLAIAGLLATLLLLTPASSKARRRR